MLGTFHGRIHARGVQSQHTLESTLFTTGALILVLLAIVILFFGVFVAPAT